jgi:hypothetical protein
MLQVRQEQIPEDIEHNDILVYQNPSILSRITA